MKEKNSANNWKRIVLITLLLVFTTHLSFSATNWLNESFDYRLEIEINNTGNENLTEFPIFLNISNKPTMQADYDDIRFYLGGCLENHSTQLNYELEYSDASQAHFWAKLQNFQSGSNLICMYYGNSTTTYGGTDPDVWNVNYDIVYHMDSTGQDSTTNNRDRVSDVGSPTSDDGYLGHGLSFDGNDAWNMQNMPYWEAEFFTRVHEIIFETSGDITTRQALFAEGGGTNGISMYIRDGELYARWWSESNPNWGGNHFNVPITTNTNYYATMYLDATGNYSLYLNGNLIATLPSPDHIDAHSGDGGIGYTGDTSKDFDNGGASGEFFEGTIYEFRTQTNHKSHNWYKQTYQNSLNHTQNTNYGVQEQYFPEIETVITTPSTALTTALLQNSTLNINTTITCIGKESSSCGDISNILQYNNSATTFNTIATTPTTPVWTPSSNPQSCILNGGDFCNLSWTINATGQKDSLHLIKVLSSSNKTSIENSSSEKLTTQIVLGNVVSFNQSSYSFTPFNKNSGDKTTTLEVISQIGDNTNIKVECQSGNCATITQNWVDGTTVNEGLSSNIEFTCNDDSSGTYNAIFNITSDEYDSSQTIEIICQINKIFGPISLDMITPTPLTTTTVAINKTFSLQANLSCIGDCGNVTAFAIYSNSSTQNNWWNSSFLKRKEITLTTVGTTTLTNYPIFVEIQKEASMQANFDDLRFIEGSCGETTNQLEYELEISNSTHTSAWVKIPNLNSTHNSICMYYNNPTATNSENPAGVWSDFTAVWHFEEDGTNDRIDSTTNSYDAMTVNYESDEKTPGVIGQADSFDGTDDHLAIRNLNFNSGSPISQMSSCVWFKTSFTGTNYNDNWAFLDFDRSEYFDFYIRGDNGAVDFSTSSGGINDQAGTTTGLNDGTWHQACVVYDGTDKIIYINGEEDARVTNAHLGNDLGTTTTRFGYIGEGSEAGSFNGGGNNIFYEGDIDELKFSFTTLSEDWINQSFQLIKNQNSFVTYGIEENFYGGEIINSSFDTPFFTLSQQPQSCIPTEDGSCLFTWEINTTGILNSLWNLSVFASSNYSQISATKSNKSEVQIVDNIIPIVTLLSPSNNSKIISNGSINFSFNIIDDLTTLNCSLYLNNVFNQTIVCPSGTNSSILVNLAPGEYVWNIEAQDDTNRINSTQFSFHNIYSYWIKIKKTISNIGTNLYLNDIYVRDYFTNTSNSIRVHDYTHNTTTAGSWSPLYDITNTTYLLFPGKIYGWDYNLTSNQSINYSITGVNDYKLEKNYIVGLE